MPRKKKLRSKSFVVLNEESMIPASTKTTDTSVSSSLSTTSPTSTASISSKTLNSTRSVLKSRTERPTLPILRDTTTAIMFETEEISSTTNAKVCIKKSTKSINKKQSKKSLSNNKRNKQDKLLIIILGTKKKHRAPSVVDGKYCKELNHVIKDYLPDSWVGYIVINRKLPLTTYINDNKMDAPFQDWIKNCEYFRDKNNKKMTIYDSFSAYMICEYEEFKIPIKITHSAHQRQYRMYFDSTDETKETLNRIKKQNPRLNILEKKNEINYMGLITATAMIGLMLFGKKKAEFRKTTLSNFISEKINHNSCVRLIKPPVTTKKIIINNVPTRKEIKTKKRDDQKFLCSGSLKKALDKYYINWKNLSNPIMHDFSVEKVKTLFEKWIFVKDLDCKNKNKSIRDHNAKILKYFHDCFNRLLFWSKQNINGESNYYLLQNFLVILFGFPQDMLTLLLILDKQYKELHGIIGHILGILKCSCSHCKSSKIKYRYSAKRTPKYSWICFICGKETSCFKNSWKTQFRSFHFGQIFKIWYQIFQNVSQKQSVSENNIGVKTHRRLKQHLFTSLRIYQQRNFIVLGDDNDHCYFDHTFKGVKRKYAKGYIKNQKWLLFGGTDEHSLFILQHVDSERKVETNYYIRKYSTPNSLIDTDCGGAFNDVEKLDQRKHRTVNHSGTKDPDTGIIHYFVNPTSGVCTNAVEAVFSRLVQKYIIRHPNDLKNKDSFANGIALFDFSYNRTNNYAQQLFINALMVLNYVHDPLQEKSLELEEPEDFTNVYEIQKIISDRKASNGKSGREFLIHWVGYALYQSTWQHEDSFIKESVDSNKNKEHGNEKFEIIEEYDLLSEIDKLKRMKAYEKSVNDREKKEIEKNAIPMLTWSKCAKFIQNQQKQNAIQIILKDGILNVRQDREQLQNESDVKIIKVYALIASQKSLDCKEECEKQEYNVFVVFHDGTPVEWNCECLAQQNFQVQKKNLMCKHCVVVMLELSIEGQDLLSKERQK